MYRYVVCLLQILVGDRGFATALLYAIIAGVGNCPHMSVHGDNTTSTPITGS